MSSSVKVTRDNCDRHLTRAPKNPILAYGGDERSRATAIPGGGQDQNLDVGVLADHLMQGRMDGVGRDDNELWRPAGFVQDSLGGLLQRGFGLDAGLTLNLIAHAAPMLEDRGLNDPQQRHVSTGGARTAAANRSAVRNSCVSSATTRNLRRLVMV